MFCVSAIVMIGNFNPSILHPEWFNKYKLLPIQETQWAEGLTSEKSEIPFKGNTYIIEEKSAPLFVTPDLSALTFKSMQVITQPDKFHVVTKKRGNFPQIKEISIKIFKMLPHTPVKSIGHNFEGHLKFNESSSEILKNLFSKKDDIFRGSLGTDYQISGELSAKFPDRTIGIRIENSKKFSNYIYISFNFHREVASESANEATTIISDCYDRDLGEGISLVKDILGEPIETCSILN